MVMPEYIRCQSQMENTPEYEAYKADFFETTKPPEGFLVKPGKAVFDRTSGQAQMLNLFGLTRTVLALFLFYNLFT